MSLFLTALLDTDLNKNQEEYSHLHQIRRKLQDVIFMFHVLLDGGEKISKSDKLDFADHCIELAKVNKQISEHKLSNKVEQSWDEKDWLDNIAPDREGWDLD